MSAVLDEYCGSIFWVSSETVFLFFMITCPFGRFFLYNGIQELLCSFKKEVKATE